MDLATRISQLEDLVRDAKSMPLSSSALVNRDEVLELIEQLKDSIPDEIKQARWIVKDREELLAKARRDAEAMVDEGRQEQLRLASHEEVVQRSHTEAARIVSEAEDEARKLRLEAEDYVDAKLAQFEIALRRILEGSQGATRALAKTLDQVEVGRERLRAPGTAAEQGLAARPAVEGTALYDEEHEEADAER